MQSQVVNALVSCLLLLVDVLLVLTVIEMLYIAALILCSKSIECPKTYTCGEKLHCIINTSLSVQSVHGIINLLLDGKDLKLFLLNIPDKSLRQKRYHRDSDYIEYYSDEGLYSSEDYDIDTNFDYEDVESHHGKRYADVEGKGDLDHFNDWMKLIRDEKFTKNSPLKVDMYRIKMSKHPPKSGLTIDTEGIKKLTSIESVQAKLKQLGATKKALIRKLKKLKSMKKQEDQAFLKLEANLKLVTNKNSKDEEEDIEDQEIQFEPIRDLENY